MATRGLFIGRSGAKPSLGTLARLARQRGVAVRTKLLRGLPQEVTRRKILPRVGGRRKRRGGSGRVECLLASSQSGERTDFREARPSKVRIGLAEASRPFEIPVELAELMMRP